MTRINTIPPQHLLDQHLFAEWRELPRVMAIARPLRPREAPDAYALGRGHLKFFYGLTGYLSARHAQLTSEVVARGFRIESRPALEPVEGLAGDWVPTADDHVTNLDRLAARQEARPGFYKLRGKPARHDHYRRLLGRVAAGGVL